MTVEMVARPIVRTLPADMTHAYIYPIGDLHLGDPACDLSKLYRYLDWVKKRDNAFILLNGDLANVAIRSSVSDTHDEEFPVKEQRKRLVRMFEPHRDRILAMTGGNHEDRISKNTGDDLNEIIASLLGIPYAADEVFLTMKVGQYSEHGKAQSPVVYRIYMTHGWAGGRRPGGTANMLEDMEHIVDADIYIGSHTHKEMGYPLDFYRWNTQKNAVTAHKHLFVSTGGYLKRKGYSVRKGYRPVHPGSPRIRLDGTKHDAHVSI